MRDVLRCHCHVTCVYCVFQCSELVDGATGLLCMIWYYACVWCEEVCREGDGKIG